MKATVFVDWDSSPHLSAQMKDSILSSIPPWQRDSRTKGIPQMGSGAIYTVPESEFTMNPIPLEPHLKRVFSLDVGWKINAALFGAYDKDSETLYIYDEIYKAKTEPAVVAAAIRARGDWIPGVIDPASRGRSQKDGTALRDIYRDLGLELFLADNKVEAGLAKTWEMLSQGRIKVFRNCTNFLAEYRLYRRDKNGNIVKSNDHLMDALRYMVMSGLQRAEQEPARNPRAKKWYDWEPRQHIFAG
jgi:hypothetical protein